MKKKKTHQKQQLSTEFNYETVIMGKNTGSKDQDYRALYSGDIRLQRLKESLPVKKGRMLDLGCGGGTITNYLASAYPEMKVYGCDISKAAISLARTSRSSKATFSVMGKDRFPYKSHYFDACICFDVLEHVPDPDAFMAETKRVLKKGGVIFFAIPCEGQPWSLTWWLQKFKFGDKLTYKHVGHIHPEFTHEHILSLFNKRGFRVVSKTYAEHFVTQCVRFVRFIIPKEALEFFLGSRSAEKYYDRAIVTQIPKKHGTGDSMMLVRSLWLKFGVVFDAIEHLEARIGKNTGFAAWKILVLARSR